MGGRNTLLQSLYIYLFVSCTIPRLKGLSRQGCKMEVLIFFYCRVYGQGPSSYQELVPPGSGLSVFR